MMLRLLLVRHGQTDWNVERRWQGHEGPALNATGRAQARAAANRLATTDLGRVELVSSDLARADETARVIAEELGLEVRHDRRLREIDVGAWSGSTHAEVVQRDPEGVEPWRRGEEAAFGGAESLGDLRRRVASFLEDLVADDRAHVDGERTVVAVTHGGVIRAGTATVLGMPELRPLRGCSNASITTIGWSADRGWSLAAYNSDEHLVAADSSQAGRPPLAAADTEPPGAASPEAGSDAA